MKLMTKEIATKLHQNDQAVIESGVSPETIVVKYFNPCGAHTWYIVSATPVDDDGEPCEIADAKDWHLFGFCYIGDARGAELGYVMLSQLEEIRLPAGLGIERDLHYSGTLSEVQEKYRKMAG